MGFEYDLKRVTCSIGGVTVSGYGETDAIALEWAGPITEEMQTADGDTIFSRTNDRRLHGTVTVSQQSRAYKLLGELLEEQHGDNAGVAPDSIPLHAFALRDPSNGDEITSQKCVLSDRPAPSKGKTAGEVQFKFTLPSPKVKYGASN